MSDNVTESVSGGSVPSAVVEKNKGFPIIWLLPIIASLIGGWLFYQSLQDAPIEVRIQFPSAEGIDVGKTEVRFKGLPVGKVTSMGVSDDLQNVMVTVEMMKKTAPKLVEGTEFWMVTPRASIAGVSGLETLLSGSYITVKPSGDLTAAPKSDFVALTEPPPLDYSVPGLHMTLEAKELGSLYVDAPVKYSDFTIGSVQAYKLREDGEGVTVSIYVSPEFSYLVKQGSRFYNSSGVSFSGDLRGFDLKLDSLATLFMGGVSLFNDESVPDMAPAVNGDTFTLYDDYVAAMAGEHIQLRLSSTEGLSMTNTQIKYKGYVIGRIESMQLTEDLQTTIATAVMVPNAVPYLNTGAQFWLVKPRLTFNEVSGLETLITGSYIEMDVGEGESSRSFDVMMNPPRLSYDVPGLHLKLHTDSLSSVERGTPITYRKIPVGSVKGFELQEGGKDILVDVFIEPEYAHLVNATTRFWNASGIHISGGISGLKIQTESVASIIRGGISFSSLEVGGNVKKSVNGDAFELHGSIEEAQQGGIEIHLDFASGEGLAVGTEIKHMGISVGEVKEVHLNEKMNGVVARAILTAEAKALAVAGSQFWVVQPKLSLTNTANLDTLVKGQYIAVKPGRGKKVTRFTGLADEPADTVKDSGVNITLKTRHLGSIKAGIKLLYRGIPVGEVTGFDLSAQSNYVLVYANIQNNYKQLIRSNTIFWNNSGIDVNFGLFKGVSLKTGSLESIVGGGISLAVPETTPLKPVASSGTVFMLKDRVEEPWLKWKPVIELKP